jgi:hypothetical protein
LGPLTHPGPPSIARRLAAVILTAAAAALGALILGEYDLAGVTPYVAGVLFGLAIAEVTLTVGRDARVWAATMSAALAVGGWLWAAWISTGEGVAPMRLGSWLGAVVAAVVAFGWVRWSGKRGGTSRAEE